MRARSIDSTAILHVSNSNIAMYRAADDSKTHALNWECYVFARHQLFSWIHLNGCQIRGYFHCSTRVLVIGGKFKDVLCAIDKVLCSRCERIFDLLLNMKRELKILIAVIVTIACIGFIAALWLPSLFGNGKWRTREEIVRVSSCGWMENVNNFWLTL